MNKKELRLYCFSPPVMLATFIIEITLAFYTAWRYKLNEVGKLVVATLICLAIFQLAEFNVCGTGLIGAADASRIGHIAITFLPPLGVHMIYALAGAKKRPFMWLVYIAGGVFSLFFLFAGHSGHECLGNYVIFQIQPDSSLIYTAYYYGLLAIALWLCATLKTKKTKAALYGVAAGYLAFILPTTAVNLASPVTLSGIPSIMCGFAVVLALILALWVMPKGGVRR